MRLLLCTDMDGTLCPNGSAREAPAARELLRTLVERVPLTLAYVTGRDKRRVREAIEHWNLPWPDFVVADVGTTVLEAGHEQPIETGQWHADDSWHERHREHWIWREGESPETLLDGMDGVSRQEPDRQSSFKGSWYVTPQTDRAWLDGSVGERLQRAGVRGTQLFSHDPHDGRGLLDLVPEGAGKLGAIEHLRKRHGFEQRDVVFCGDSGNDLDVLTSELPSVLVANADEPTREAALEGVRDTHNEPTLYLATGTGELARSFDLDGNFAAGIVEGVLHYHPALARHLLPGARSA